MKSLVRLVAFFIAIAGVTALAAPETLISIGRRALTQDGLYAIGALRVVIGLVLWLAAPAARMPKTLRVLGAITIVSGVITPFLGVERARSIGDWEIAQGLMVIRAAGIAIIALAGFLVFAAGTRRQPA